MSAKEFFNKLGYPYSITYAERLAEHCPPGAYWAAKGLQGCSNPPEGGQKRAKIDIAE